MGVATDIRIGTELAGYRIEALLGRGGMSVVYRAHDPRLKRPVALKLLSAELAEDDEFRTRFLRESELAASLDHPNVVPVYEAGDVEGLLYIAMRYVEGTDLRALLRSNGALAPRRAISLVAQVADALDVAHDRGLVHRDVKPSNVLVSPHGGTEHCYLADFGLTKSSSERSALTDAGRLIGTIDYVAPEQIRGGPIDGRADVYSLTCLLYECLTGELPFGRRSDVAALYAHLEEEPPRASARNHGLPRAIDGVLASGMAKSAADRYETCSELVSEARQALEGVPAGAPRGGTVRRRVTRVALAAAAVAAGALTLVFAVGGGTPAARADTLVRMDPAGGRTAGGLEVHGRPSSVVTCAGSVWVTSLDGTVSQIDPQTLASTVIRVRGVPGDVADVGNLAAVVGAAPRTTVTMIDAATGTPATPLSVPGGASASPVATAWGGDVWIANPNAHELDRLSTPYTRITERTGLAPRAPGPRAKRYSGVAFGAGAVWVAGDANERTLWRVDPRRQRVVATIPLRFAPRAVAVGQRGVWVLDPRGAVVRIDPATYEPVARIRVGRDPVAVAAGGGSVWVVNRRDGTVSRIDASRNEVVKTIEVGSDPIDVAFGLDTVWVVRAPTSRPGAAE
jgi:YVTN family beta-propeller protein